MVIVRNNRTKLGANSFGLNFLAIIFLICGLLIILKLVQLQIINYQKYKEGALKIRSFEKEIEPARGKIFVEGKKERYPVALNMDSYDLYAVPKEVEDPSEAAQKLSLILKISSDEKSEDFANLVNKLSKENDWYEIIKKDLTETEVNEIKKLNLRGVDFEIKQKRFYPEGKNFSHILGFVGYKGDKKIGRYGLEEYYENILSGKEGILKGERTLGDIIIATAKNINKKPKDGADLVLTIDRVIQVKVCETLEEAVKKYEAEGGTIIVVDAKTGALLALCNAPSFDPNKYNEVKNINVFPNEAVNGQHEPGSIFKVITMAAGFEEGKITPETTYEDKGLVKIGGYTIKNAAEKVYGVKNMREVLEKSINTGAIFVGQKVGLEKFRHYVEKFGFGQLTGITLPGEVKADIKNLFDKKEIYLATASFGQGLAVTSLQMVMSFAVIANDGKLMKPYLVKEIISGDFITKIEPREIRQVISPAAAEVLKDMLVSVVENGWSKRAAVKGYLVAGKTGTAQVAYLGKYSSKTTHSFAGFAPANNPRFVAIVKLDNPQLEKFSDRTAAPTFGQIADFLLKYFEIPPTEE